MTSPARTVFLGLLVVVLVASATPAAPLSSTISAVRDDGGYELLLYTEHAMKRPPSDPLFGMPEGSYLLEDGRVAVPLKLPKPGWYNPVMHEKVVAAAQLGMGYDVEQGVAVPLASNYLFIRPGAMMLFPSGCTMNFIYGSSGSYQIGSAGHCNARGDEVVIVAAPSLLVAIGKTKASHDNGIGDDWSLVDIYPQFQKYVDANTPVGGPQCGAYTGDATITSPVPIKHFGHGLVVGTGGTPRAGVSTEMDSKAFYFNSPSMPGDSGSGVQHAGTPECPLGEAIGVLTHLVIGTKTLPSHMAGTLLSQVRATVTDGDVNPLP